MSRWNVGPAALAALAALVASLALAASATAKPLPLTFKERAGDAPSPALDLVGAGLRYDRAKGLLVGAVVLGAPPTSTGIDSVDVDLGRYALANGQCYGITTVSIAIPRPQDIEVGLTQPYTEVLRYISQKSIGFLSTATNGATITFSTTEASQEVVRTLKRGRFTCAKISTHEPVTFDRRDRSGPAPFFRGRPPTCRIAKRSVRGGHSLPVRCKRAGKRVGVHLAKGRALYEGHERVRRGRFRVPTSRSMHGRWNITIWKGEVLIGRFLRVRVR